jgi:hypothetical protein
METSESGPTHWGWCLRQVKEASQPLAWTRQFCGDRRGELALLLPQDRSLDSRHVDRQVEGLSPEGAAPPVTDTQV